MAEEKIAITEAMNLLEAEPSSEPVGVVQDLAAPGPDIPALREQLAVLVSTGKAKEAIGVQSTYEQVNRLFDKDVEKYYKRYEAFVGAKTTDSLIGSFLMLATKAMCTVRPVKNVTMSNEQGKTDTQTYDTTKQYSKGFEPGSDSRLCRVIVRVRVVLKRTVVGDSG